MREPQIDLLCLPCAGGSATMYQRWRHLLPAWIRVVPVELPGRGGRLAEVAERDFDTLVARLCREQSARSSSRFALFGHSMGALLAHGMTQHLRDSGRPLPQALFVSASAAPSRRAHGRLPLPHDDAGLIADLRKQGGTPREVFEHKDLLRMTLDALGADYRVCDSYHHRPAAPLSLPLHVYGGREDGIETERLQAWQLETTGRFSLSWFEGGHFFLREQEGLLLQAIVRELMQQFAWVRPAAVAVN